MAATIVAVTTAILALALVGVALAGVALAAKRHTPRGGTVSIPPVAPSGPAGQAMLAYAAMQKYLYTKHTHLYRGPNASHVWGFSQGLAATTSVSRLPGVGGHYAPDLRDRLYGLEAYWDPSWDPPGYVANVAPPRGGRGGHLFYDDNDWIGIELARLYRTDHQPHELQRAQQIFNLSVAAWDDSPSQPCPGGVPFSDDDSSTDRNVVTNAPGAELALQLYGLTHNPVYLNWAKRMYGWVRTCLSLDNSLYADHIDAQGNVDPTIYSYTQGVMIGAGTMLYGATGDASYLAQAQATAKSAFAYYDAARLAHEPRFFVAVYFRNLLLLDRVAPNPAYRAVVQGYADWAWSTQRQAQTNLFTFGAPGVKLLDQATMIQIYAMLTMPIETFY